jgi:hypothetical protein
MNVPLSRAALRIATAYRIGYDTIWLEMQARNDWLGTGMLEALSEDTSSTVESIREYVESISNMVPDPGFDTLGTQYIATLDRAMSELVQVWDTPDHLWIFQLDAESYEGRSERLFKGSVFEIGAWADLHLHAKTYRDRLPSDLRLGAELGTYVALVMLAFNYIERKPIPGLSRFPVRKVQELLSQVSVRVSLFKELSDTFTRDYQKALGLRPEVEREWGHRRVRELSMNIRQLLDSANPYAGFDEHDWICGSRRELNEAFGVSPTYARYLEKRQAEHSIILDRENNKGPFRVQIHNEAEREKVRAKLLKLQAKNVKQAADRQVGLPWAPDDNL